MRFFWKAINWMNTPSLVYYYYYVISRYNIYCCLTIWQERWSKWDLHHQQISFHLKVRAKWLLLSLIYNTKMPLESDDGKIKTFHVRDATWSNYCLSVIIELAYYLITFLLNCSLSQFSKISPILNLWYKSQIPACCCRVLPPSVPGCMSSPFSHFADHTTVMWGDLSVTYFLIFWWKAFCLDL